MKITAVTDHAGLFARLKLGFITLMMGGPKDVADIVRLLLYRPAFFGSSFNHYCQTLLRGPSDWTVGERELIGTWVSQTNECRFCTSIHREVAVRSLPGGAAVVDAALRDPNSAGLSPQMTALLPFLRKLTRTPGEVTPQDARSVLASGVSRAALEQAIHISALFSTINRIADSLGFEVQGPTGLSKSAEFLLKRGYEM